MRRAPLLSVALILSACGSQAAGRIDAPKGPRLARWTPLVHISRPLDVTGPRSGGSLIVAAAGRLSLLTTSNRVRPYASGYRSPGGEEPYVTLSPGGCFGRGTVYALRLATG